MAKKRSAWLTHVMSVKAKHPKLSFKECLKKASASWSKKKAASK